MKDLGTIRVRKFEGGTDQRSATATTQPRVGQSGEGGVSHARRGAAVEGKGVPNVGEGEGDSLTRGFRRFQLDLDGGEMKGMGGWVGMRMV